MSDTEGFTAVPSEIRERPAASAVIKADRDSQHVSYSGLAEALTDDGTDQRIFGKPTSRPYRRMGVALANVGSIEEA